MGIGDKIKDTAHKMGIGHTERTGARETTADYGTTGTGTTGTGTYGTTTGATTRAGYGTTTGATTGVGASSAATGYEAGREAGTGGRGEAGYAGGAAGYEGAGQDATAYTGGAGGQRSETYQTTAEVPVAVQQTTTTAPRATEARGASEVCGQEYFTKTEDRPIVKERVQYVTEHRPVEQEYVVETRATGREREVAEGRAVESMGTQERVVSEAQPKAPCE